MAKDNFDFALKHLLKHEGGYVNHPKDPGGRTNLGVTQRAWEEYIGRKVDEQEMRSLTAEQVTPFYKTRYWNLVRGDELPAGVDYCAFDVAVNSGVGRAVRFLQLASGVVADGLIGPGTMGAIAKIDPTELVKKICNERREFLHRLDTFDTFGKGWMRRVSDVERVALEMADVSP
jgi:lysozyme family protein